MIFINEGHYPSFHLTNGKLSYIFHVLESTQTLEQLYYGAAIKPRDNYDYLIEREVRPSNNLYQDTHTTSFEHIKQEFPVYGTTDFRYPAIEIAYPDGDHISHLSYVGYTQLSGKHASNLQPMLRAGEEDAATLIIHLKDNYSQAAIDLHYTIYREQAVIVRRVVVHNHGEESLRLKRLLSMSIDFPHDDFELLHLYGAWARETHLERKPLIKGVQNFSSTRGASSHAHNPFLALVAPNTSEHQGETFGFSLVYSGNFLSQIEVDTYHVTRVSMGINPFQFDWHLDTGESFESPEVVMAYSSKGLNGMSQQFHDIYRQQLLHNETPFEKAPVLLNSWEANYFDFDEEKLLEQAQLAKDLGFDLFVLDDGWFGKRDSDNGSLGNWTTDLDKIPQGIRSLASNIQAMGIHFGLWFEPEMLSVDTPVYQAHPEWIIGHPNKNISHGRNQFVLDFSNPDVVANIFEQMSQILGSAEIDYIKWDMNRYISEPFSNFLKKHQQGELFHRYILGVYDLLDRIRKAFPAVFIETCAGGGGRYDPAMLFYANQNWISDDTDAIERLKIQYGASMVYPISTMGSHVSEIPNHQVGRITSLKMRKDVALFGTFGYELDIMKLSDADREEVRQQINQFNQYQSLLHHGDFYRLNNPFEAGLTAWMVVSKDQSEAIVGVYQSQASANPAYERIQLAGLASDQAYELLELDHESKDIPVRYGDDLMAIGLILNENFTGRADEYWGREKAGEYHSRVFYLKIKKDK
ncbi:alpha-galactosidase [Fundicoccus sp. Sow4_D5]|uniref:alpha-galactosidase n=1 Tax=Fundicoccus sp. Sow4_D5 TaxID=3438782 RepID=UPI003F93AA63